MLETGVPNLDLILGGGVPKGYVLLVVGPAGSGKTTLSLQLSFRVAASGEKALYVATVSEPPTKLIANLRSFAFCDESLVGSALFVLNMYPSIKQSLDRVADELIEAVKAHKAQLVVVDGLMTIHDLHAATPAVRMFIYDVGSSLAALGCTTVVTSSGFLVPSEHQAPEFTMADGIIELAMKDVGTQTVRTVRARKMRGLAPLLGEHALRLDGRGLVAYPRLESLPVPAVGARSSPRVPLGLPELDGMMTGGFPAESVAILAGAGGTGKTLMCLYYLLEGTRRGEKGLLLGFRESPSKLFDKARTFGLDLETPVREGRILLVHRQPIDLVVDEVSWELWREMERFDPDRVAIDSLSELEYAIDDRRRPGYMAALANMLRGRRSTTLVTKEVAQGVGPELDFSDSPLEVLAEVLLLLRYVDYRTQLFRIASILKMRDSAFDPSLREYTITEQGLHVRAVNESPEGLVTGISRLPSEARVKRERGGRPEGW